MAPDTPQQRSLRAEVEALRQAVGDLNRVMALQVEEKVAEVSVPRQELRTRLRRNFWSILVIMALVVVVAVGVNRVTLLQAQRAFGEQVTTCFLRPGAVTPAQARKCDRWFSTDGHEYLRIQERSAQANRQFQDLQNWARSKGWKPPP